MTPSSDAPKRVGRPSVPEKPEAEHQPATSLLQDVPELKGTLLAFQRLEWP